MKSVILSHGSSYIYITCITNVQYTYFNFIVYYIDQYIILFFIVAFLIIFTYMQYVVAISLPKIIVKPNHTYLRNKKILLIILSKKISTFIGNRLSVFQFSFDCPTVSPSKELNIINVILLTSSCNYKKKVIHIRYEKRNLLSQ